jgi:hypothetical protein
VGLDVQRAAAAGDAATVVLNLRTLLAMSRHARETPLLISGLVGNAIFNIARERIDWILATRADLLGDEQWVTLAHALAAHSDRVLAAELSGERTGFKDILQRLYTDDGAGDGRLTPLGVRWLKMLGSSGGSNDREGEAIDWALDYGAPALSAIVLGRRAMNQQHERLMSMIERENATPLWQREQSQADQLLEQWMSSPLERVRHLPLCRLMPALGRVSINAELSCLQRDATITAIALELYRRKHGEWPATLAQLLPTTMPALPIDRFDGQTLRYRLQDGRPLLYSVGSDREDDGGVLPPLAMTGNRQFYARQWLAPADLARMNDSPTIIGPDGQTGPMYDGDWLLWPPLPEGPLRSSSTADLAGDES